MRSLGGFAISFQNLALSPLANYYWKEVLDKPCLFASNIVMKLSMYTRAGETIFKLMMVVVVVGAGAITPDLVVFLLKP